MKIGLVSPYDLAYPGGVTEHVSHLAAEFSAPTTRRTSSRLLPQRAGTATAAGRAAHSRRRPRDARARQWVRRADLHLADPRTLVKRLLDDEQFDVVHLHEPLMPALPLTVLRYSHALTSAPFTPSASPTSRPTFMASPCCATLSAPSRTNRGLLRARATS